MSVPFHSTISRKLVICAMVVLQFYPGVRTADAESRIIKCTSASGQVVFSQTGCDLGVRERIKVDNPEMGWINLEKVVAKFKTKKVDEVTNEETKKQVSTSSASDRTQQQRCWRAKNRVAQITRQLKQGYRLAQGEKLRYQRKEQEEYLALFCKKTEQ